MVDTTVTGSECGTSDNPKFSLLKFFMEVVFPRLQEMTDTNGQFPGYHVVIQGDNADPHTDKIFVAMKSYCATHGSLWEPQALQMPYVNNLDLMVFPAMSKQHSMLLSNHSNTVAKHDVIYRTTLDVWNSLDHSVIASGYVLAYWISKKSLPCKEATTF